MNTHVEPFTCPDCGSPLTDRGFACGCRSTLAGIHTSDPQDDLVLAPQEEVDLFFFPESETEAETPEHAEPEPDPISLSPSKVIPFEPPPLSSPQRRDEPVRLQGTFIGMQPTATDPSISGRFAATRREKLDAPVEPRPPKPSAFLSWLGTLVIALVAGIGGGFAVYFLGPDRPPIIGTSASNSAVADTEIRRGDIFVNRNTNTAVTDTLVPETENTSQAEGGVERPGAVPLRPGRTTEMPGETAANPPSSNAPAAAEQPSQNADTRAKEANVAGMVVERSSGKRPIARCADGTYSYAATRSAACTQRGGVSDWVENGKPLPSKRSPNVAYILGPRGGCYYIDAAQNKVYVDKKHCL